LISLEAPFFLVSVLGAVVFVLLTVASGDDRCKRPEAAAKSRSTFEQNGPEAVTKKREIAFFFFVVLCLWSAAGSWASMNVVFAYKRLNWGPADFGIASAVVNVIVMVYQIKLQPKIIKKIGAKRCFAIALMGNSLAFVLFAAVAWLTVQHWSAAPIFCAGYLVLTFCMHTASSCVSIITMTHYATPKTRGLLAGLLNTTRMLAMAVAPLAYLRVFRLGHADKGWLFASTMTSIGCIGHLFGPTRACREDAKVNSA